MSSEAAAENMDVVREQEAVGVQPPTLPRRRLDCIDFLRGTACLWVIIHHSLGRSAVPTQGSLWFRGLVAVANIGWLGVSLFLVLSGFCLYYPIAVRMGVANGRVDVKVFAVRRLRRIMPPYLISLALFAGFGILSAHKGHFWRSVELFGWKDIAAHVFMVHNLRATTIASINSSYWSLALESQLYIVFPLFVALAARRGVRTVCIVTLVVSLLWQYAVHSRLGFSVWWLPQFALFYHALPARCFEFVMGMTAAALVADPKPKQEQMAALLIGLLILPALWFVLFVSRYGVACDQAWGVIFAGIVVLLARIPDVRFERHALLKTAVWLGTISCSVYLVHQPLVFLLSPERLHLDIGSEQATALFTLARLLVITAIGYVFYHLGEKPFTGSASRSSQGNARPLVVESKSVHAL